MKGFVEKDATIDGVRLHYAEGPEAGPPLVLVPGQSMPWQSYTRVLPRLSKRFHVYVLDVRGHGQSQHTPGQYSFTRCGKDLVGFLREVVKRPAACCGNSSGGLIALYAAAEAPELVTHLLMEDPPLFTTEWPQSQQTWVHGFFVHVVKTLPDLATFFSTLRVPREGNKTLMNFPRPLAWVLGGAIRRRQARAPNQPVDIAWLPLQVRLFVRGLSEYDVDFTRACTDGSLYDLDQTAALAKVRCPALLIQAHSFVHPELGLVGAMGEEHVAKARQVLPALKIEHWPKPHVVHIAAPARYAEAIETLTSSARPS